MKAVYGKDSRNDVEYKYPIKDVNNMKMYDIITKKRDGQELNEKELFYFIEGIVNKQIPDYQSAALLMAIYLNGMNKQETSTLCRLMAQSGDTMEFSKELLTVDKHSTGGVGDKTSFIVGPITAAAGLTLAKMSGRALGHTGGTVDKLESIPGMKVDLDLKSFEKIYRETGICISGQSGNMVPADKILYGLRDVTATVGSIPLIASSIMSKKLAAGAENIVLDVKSGSGSFMNDRDQALKLADTMVQIGIANNRNIAALVTSMDAPLGYCIGNALEVQEAIEVLKGGLQKTDLYKVSISLAAELISMALKIPINEAIEVAAEKITQGTALEKFSDMIKAQGGDSRIINDFNLFKNPRNKVYVKAEQTGYIKQMDAKAIGIVSMNLGAGRIKKEDPIDYSAGIRLLVKPGDKVVQNEVIAYLYSDLDNLENQKQEFSAAVSYSKQKPETGKTILGRVTKNGREIY